MGGSPEIRALQNYSRQLASLNVDDLTTGSDCLAFFINACNSNTLLLVIRQFPGIESVMNPMAETGERGDLFRQRVRIGMANWTRWSAATSGMPIANAGLRGGYPVSLGGLRVV